MSGYYDSRLAGARLDRVYEIAPRRVRQYLQGEIDHLCGRLSPGDRFLELGCGTGRILFAAAPRDGMAVGIDTSVESLRRAAARDHGSLRLAAMDATALGFPDSSFDLVACLQNGISAFHADRAQLIREAVRVTRSGGIVLFSSYAERFWEPRLDWFRRQAAEGLLGPIDDRATGAGRIVCTDGFTADTVGPEEFGELVVGVAGRVALYEVDASIFFCEIVLD